MFRNLFDNPVALLLLVFLVVVLFGASKLPNAARQMGRSMRIFKSEIKEMKKDDDADRPGGSTRASEPLEGRVVDDHAPRVPHATTSDSDRRDA